MILLFKAALRSRKHLALLITSFLTLIALTIANFLEISALGILINADTLSQLASNQKISPSILNLAGSSDEKNPLQWVIGKAQALSGEVSSFTVLISVLLGVALFKALALFWSRYMTQIMAIRISRDLRLQYFEHIQTLPMSFYQKHNIGSLSSRVVGDANQIALSINSFLTNYLHAPFTVLITLITCFISSWQLSLIVFLGVPLIAFPIVTLAKRVRKVSKLLQSNQEKFASVLIDFLAGIQTVKIFAMESFSFKKYEEQNDRMAMLESKNAKYALLTRPILHFITTICLASVVLFGLLVLGISVSQLVIFCGFLQLSYETLKKFGDENANMQRGIAAAERMFEVLHLRPEIEDAPHAIMLTEFKDKIEFHHVGFRYAEKWILKDLSFTVKKGETVAIVGPTGSGKSTIVQLIPRLYEVQEGNITIDGKPLSAYTQKSIREQIGFVPQKPFLFSDTISANISFGKPFSEKEIKQAAIKAHADEFITKLSSGYESLVAESGQNLSGGQQQRLAIARALVKKAPILVLDEATSSLDVLSEHKIKAAIQDLHGEVTQIIIAHRLGTIQHADRIIFLDQGVKLAEGTKEELLKSCEPFRLMWDMLSHKEESGAG
ncbi:ABC transporter ATP-binding protein [Rhabdochlamydiaceae symbiont of Dictyostelium giganteum]|uniref:ABC transporter ATP-binding protein n=1 Tax=Rhabdochlamydiaceae symbiont of Dictyostelium giganteum TaxID=3342349 RepID=UPI0038515D54